MRFAGGPNTNAEAIGECELLSMTRATALRSILTQSLVVKEMPAEFDFLSGRGVFGRFPGLGKAPRKLPIELAVLRFEDGNRET
jgi:hypothetical protein